MNVESKHNINTLNAKLMHKSENIHRVHQYQIIQFETKTHNLKSKLKHYSLKVRQMNCMGVLLFTGYESNVHDYCLSFLCCDLASIYLVYPMLPGQCLSIVQS